MKSRILKIFVMMLIPAACLFPAGTRAQNCPKPEKWNGYWIEHNAAGLTNPSILVFDQNEQKLLEGAVYFVNSENHIVEYSMINIRMSGDSLSFEINKTCLSFSGVISSETGCKGRFTMNGGKIIPVGHSKVSFEFIQEFLGKYSSSKKKIIRREINARDGLIIS